MDWYRWWCRETVRSHTGFGKLFVCWFRVGGWSCVIDLLIWRKWFCLSVICRGVKKEEASCHRPAGWHTPPYWSDLLSSASGNLPEPVPGSGFCSVVHVHQLIPIPAPPTVTHGWSGHCNPAHNARVLYPTTAEDGCLHKPKRHPHDTASPPLFPSLRHNYAQTLRAMSIYQ